MPITETKFALECEPDNAFKFWDWIQTRGGVAKWRSANLSNPGASWSTPATIRRCDLEGPKGHPDDGSLAIVWYPKPTWQAESIPIIISDPKSVGVYECEMFKAFPVALRMRGLSSHLTDASQRKLDKAMDECREKHGDAFYKRGVLEIEHASMGVFYTKSIQPLDEYIAQFDSTGFSGKVNRRRVW